MDDLLDDVVRVARRCERAARAFEGESLSALTDRLNGASESLGKAWSGSWTGFFSCIYKSDLSPRSPADVFDPEWYGVEEMMDRTQGRWAQFAPEQIKAEILRRAGDPDLKPLTDASESATRVVEEAKLEILTSLDAVLSSAEDSTLRELRTEIDSVKIHSATDLIRARSPGTVITRNSLAAQQGLRTPPHVQFEAWVFEQLSPADAASSLAKAARRIAMYMKKRLKMTGKTAARTDGKVFIGHGGSPEWRKLKEFLVERLGLEVEEYNTVSTAGKSRKERLQEMLESSVFAFLVMTAEDEHADGTHHARENVIHEVGLFQGRYGFERAIVMLEDGCTEFSNIAGIDQLRFPEGAIESKWEDVRRVLEREEIIGS